VSTVTILREQGLGLRINDFRGKDYGSVADMFGVNLVQDFLLHCVDIS
jgi:hypothetical protein